MIPTPPQPAALPCEACGRRAVEPIDHAAECPHFDPAAKSNIALARNNPRMAIPTADGGLQIDQMSKERVASEVVVTHDGDAVTVCCKDADGDDYLFRGDAHTTAFRRYDAMQGGVYRTPIDLPNDTRLTVNVARIIDADGNATVRSPEATHGDIGAHLTVTAFLNHDA